MQAMTNWSLSSFHLREREKKKKRVRTEEIWRRLAVAESAGGDAVFEIFAVGREVGLGESNQSIIIPLIDSRITEGENRRKRYVRRQIPSSFTPAHYMQEYSYQQNRARIWWTHFEKKLHNFFFFLSFLMFWVETWVMSLWIYYI